MQLTAPSTYSKGGEFFIPNAVSGNVGEETNDALVQIIFKYERELLISVLGEEQYKIFKRVAPHVVYDYWGWTWITGRGKLLKGKGHNIRLTSRVEHGYAAYDGCDYQVTLDCWNDLIFGKALGWKGLARMAACYVFYNYMAFHSELRTPIGPIKGEAFGGTLLAPAKSQVTAFNELVDQYHELQVFLRDSKCLSEAYCQSFLIGPHRIMYKNRFLQ